MCVLRAGTISREKQFRCEMGGLNLAGSQAGKWGVDHWNTRRGREGERFSQEAGEWREMQDAVDYMGLKERRGNRTRELEGDMRSSRE